MTASRHMVETNGLRFGTMVDGPVSGDLAILLHGFPEGAESWLRPVHALAKAGCLAVAPDTRGYGMSDAPEGVELYAMDHLVEDVVGLIRSFGRTRAHIAGHDWGALVAWFFASRHPEMTESLTVLSVGHPAALAAATASDVDQQERSRYVGLFLTEGKAEQVLAEDDYRRVRGMLIGRNPKAVPASVVDKYVRSLSRPGRMTAALNYYRANLSGDSAWASLKVEDVKVTAPTLLMWGDQDPALGRRSIEETAPLMTGDYRLVVLEGAGHWLQFERPDEVTRSLIEAVSN
jgi:pimeloyl-ACP methyl ester carboxylesterase